MADRDSIAAAIEEFGDVDVLVANAGIAHYRPFRSCRSTRRRQMNDVNWLGTVNTVRAALPGMLERGARPHRDRVLRRRGARVPLSAAVYGATKAAQRGFAEALRHELYGTGVSVTTVYPGEIETSLHDHELDHMPDWYRMEKARAGRAARPSEVVEAVENDQRELFYPPLVRLLRVVHGISPRLGDRMLRRSSAGRVPRRAEPHGPAAEARRSSRSSRAPRRSCPRARTGATSPSGTASDDRLPRRRRRVPPEPQRQADEPLLPGDRRAGAGAADERLVLDGEMMVVVDGVQEFDLLGQRIHPAASRVELLREETPGSFVAFDLLAEGDEALLALPYDERRERLRGVVATRSSSRR